jgi:hypothetical protein
MVTPSSSFHRRGLQYGAPERSDSHLGVFTPWYDIFYPGVKFCTLVKKFFTLVRSFCTLV